MSPHALLAIGCLLLAAACSGDDDASGRNDAASGGRADARSSSDAGAIDGSPGVADSGPMFDSTPLPGCGDYLEANDPGNDTLVGGTAEPTGITFAAGDRRVVCGVIDPAQADADVGVVDIDGFDVEVGAGAPLRVVLRTSGADQVEALVVFLQLVSEDGPRTVASGAYVDGYALATNNLAVAGTWRLVVFATPGDTLPAGPIAYELEIVDRIPCEAAAGVADFTEGADGTSSRRNDVVTADWSADPVTSLTVATTDSPEETGATLAVGTAVHLAGVSADVSPRQDYFDRDTFLVATGPGVNEIDVRLSWPDGDIDMDQMVFAEGMPEVEMSRFAGVLIGTNSDEVLTARVPNESNLWMWAGSYSSGGTDLPVAYDMTVCPRSFDPLE